MTDLTTEFEQLAIQHLPAATAGALTKYLEEAKETKRLLKEAEKDIELLKDEVDKFVEMYNQAKDKLDKHSELDIKENALYERELKVEERERNIKLEIAEIRLEALGQVNNNTHYLVDKVFGHPAVTVSTCKSNSLHDIANGYATQIGTSFENTDTTTKQTKE